MKTFKYKSPILNGYTQIYISRKEHNNIFPKRQLKIYDKYCYYINDKNFIIERYNNMYAKICIIILFPLCILYAGFPEAWIELKHSLFMRKYGSYSSDYGSCHETLTELKKRI